MSRAIAGVVLAAWLCSLVHAQSAAQAKSAEAKLEFEVASIKPSPLPARGVIRIGPQGGPGSGDPGRVTYTFSTIRDLMVDAYSVKRYQISGGPKWLDSERFDIVAKVPVGATKEQVKVMLQNLLAERFKLTLHRETKELPVYALVVGAKGPKLKDSTVTDAPPASDSQPRGWTRRRRSPASSRKRRNQNRARWLSRDAAHGLQPPRQFHDDDTQRRVPDLQRPDHGWPGCAAFQPVRPPGNRPDRLEGQVRFEAALRPIEHAGRTRRLRSG